MQNTDYSFFRGARTLDSSPSMLNYLRGFDPISEKYELREWNQAYRNWNNAPKKLLTLDGRTRASIYEASFQYNSISKHRYSFIMENLKLVYGEPDMIHSDIVAYHLVERKIVHEFLAIPQLEKMFDEDYFNFEWDMHVGQDFNEHRSDYYRDHFIHQIRDMYMMLVFLEKFRFYHSAREILSDNTASSISAYFGKKKQEFLNDFNSPRNQLLFSVSALTQDPWNSKEAYSEEFFFNYVIKASCILAGLFHDMGYPICHFLQTRNRLSSYNPTLYMFTHNEVSSFDQIASILSPSLLFSLVSLKNIKISLELNDNGKYDHGAYSAIAFLLQFYNNGLIFSLPTEKRCAIELAAVAIYNHTVKYHVVEGKRKSDYYSLYYRQNPVAFLLRVCDDLQEWDRRYFEISETSDLLFCNNCHTPLLKRSLNNNSIYFCGCSSAITPLVHRPDIFLKRKLYLVSMAETITACAPEDENTPTISVCVNYDLYKLLMMTVINNTYAKYRFKELAGLQKLLENQNYGTNVADIKVEYFMSANPLLIKLEILQRYIQNTDFTGEKTDYDSKLRIINRNPKTLISALNYTPQKNHKTLIYAYIKFYISLLLEKSKNTRGFRNLFYNTAIAAYEKKNPFYHEVIDFLANDALTQFEDRCKKGKYISSSKEALLYTYISAYTSSGNSFNLYDEILNSNVNGVPYIGFYFDIWLFKQMWDSFQ